MTVDKQFRQIGIGKKLLRYAQEHVAVIGQSNELSLRAAHNAIPFYFSYGFESPNGTNHLKLPLT